VSDRENLLEIGMAVLLMSLLGGVGLALAGRAAGRRRQTRQQLLPAPEPGSVSPEHHQNIAGAAAR